jgi:hypothetical protein
LVNDYCSYYAELVPPLPATAPRPTPGVGLCATCRHRQEVHNTRGSTFFLCTRSRADPAYPRYPRLPVLECRGYERGPATGG